MRSATQLNNGWKFSVWAPEKHQMILHIVDPFDEEFLMQKDDWGYFSIELNTSYQELQYFFKPEGGKDFPDPASQFQPKGVHGPSQTIDHSSFQWNDQNWKSLPFEELVIYELHVGLFTNQGTFEAIIPRLDNLKEIGINAIELMPVAQFPGKRNWGYDGTYPYAVQNSYGGPEGLKKLIDACHQKGIAVFLDVVYNHLGPEGNYLSHFGPYFTNKYCTPWGNAINYDGEWSDGVREYFSDNAVYWFEEYHLDGLRCDAIHAVFDNSAVHFWELLYHKIEAAQKKLGRPFYLIAESDLNSPKVVKKPDAGYGFRAQWLDDFHHALYVLINPADADRYYDFGSVGQLAKAYTDGFVHSGEWVKFRKKKHGASSAGVPGDKFVVFNQNHDQIGNRVGGERLCMLVDFERIKLAAAAILLSPYIPMLFMGEEYADDTPFFYFVDHSDPELIKAVQEGRKKEFKDFGFHISPPNPQDEETFNRSKIQWAKRSEGHYKIMLQWHQELISLRKQLAPLKNFDKEDVEVQLLSDRSFAIFRTSCDGAEKIVCLFNLSHDPVFFAIPASIKIGNKILDSKEDKWTIDPREFSNETGIIENERIRLLPLSVTAFFINSADR